MTTATAATPAAARKSPFVGPRPFRFGQPLFGRDREIPNILDLLIAERIVLLFSPSGAGKTSLIQAGLIPELRDEGFFDLPIIRVKQPTPKDGAGAPGRASNRFIQGTLASLGARRPIAPEEPPAHLGGLDSLKPALDYWADALRQGDGARPPRLVLIFDQFEEVLTTDPTDRAAKEDFFVQLGTVLKEDQGLWALFAMREEFVAALEPYLNDIPRRLASRFRLDLLDANAARQAFEQPLKSRDITVAPGALDKLLADLSRVRIQGPDGALAEVAGPYVEPVHLQILGLRLWDRVASMPGFQQLDETHLSGTEGSVDKALAGYYADKVEKIGEHTPGGERAVREWCEGHLITDQGLRGQVLREPGQTRGLPEEAIEELKDAFLVRAEVRRGSTWYELAHDRLIGPVRDSNKEWRDLNLHPLLLPARDWERAKRPDSLLLRDRRLASVEAWAKAHDAILVDAERDFLLISRRTWDEEQSRRTSHNYLNMAIGGCVVLFLVSALIASLFFRARRAERDAVDGRKRAESAESVAEEARLRERLAKENEQKQRQLASRRASELTIDRGISLCRQGLTDDGLLWLMRGLKQAQTTEPTEADRALDSLARLELAAWRPELTSLRWSQKSRDRVRAAALSPDGRTAITGGEDGTVRLWDLATGRNRESTWKHDGGVLAVTVSPDGLTAITGSEDWTARLWDLASGLPRPKGPPLRHDGPVAAVAISPDGRTALTGSEDETARLWDLASGKSRGKPLPHDGWVQAVAISPDGRTALTGTHDGTARFWDVASRGRLLKLRYDHGVTAAAFDPDGLTAIIGREDGSVRLWVLPAARPDHLVAIAVVGSFLGYVAWDPASLLPRSYELPPRQDGQVLAVAMGPDGRTALTGSLDGTARLWDLASGLPKGPPLMHDRGVVAVALGGPDGVTAITGSWDNTVRLWDIASGLPQGPPLIHRGPVLADTDPGQTEGRPLKRNNMLRAVALSPDGRTALTGSTDGTARLWDLASGHPKDPPLKHDQKGVIAVAISPDGLTAITGGEDGTARFWDVASGRDKSTRKLGDDVTALAFRTDGRSALAGSKDGTVRLWDLDSGLTEKMLKLDDAVTAVAFSPDGRTALAGSEDGTARLWDLISGKSKGPLKHRGRIIAVAISPDGRTALTGSWDRTARLWDVETLKPKGPPLGHAGPVTGAAFSPDGKLVLTSSSDDTAQLWFAKSQRPIGAPSSHNGSVLGVAFSPDGRFDITACADGTARIWQTPRAVEGKPERLELWIRVLTSKELLDSDEVRSIDPDRWQADRESLDRLGGPPGPPAAGGETVSPPR